MIKKYSNYINEATQTAYLNDNQGGPGFYTNKYGPNSLATLNSDILEYITGIYESYGFSYQSGNKDIDDRIDIDRLDKIELVRLFYWLNEGKKAICDIIEKKFI